jgi:hypothetical protein
MKRTVYSPLYGAQRDRSLPISTGGTSAYTAPNALVNLGAAAKAKEDVASGIAILGADLRVKPENVPASVGVAATVQGPTTVYTYSSSTHTITNYDIATTYVISATLGTVTRSGDTITYTAGSVAGNDNLVINGKNFPITVAASYIAAPTITSPTDGATDRPASLTVTCSDYSPQGACGTHVSSTWQVATDSEFSNIIAYTNNDSNNKTAFNVTGLVENTTYYVRVFQTSSNGISSAWSSVTTFKTRVSWGACLLQSVISATETGNAASESQPTYYVLSNDGTYAFIGMTSLNSNTGALYIFKRSGTTYSLLTKIIPSDVQQGEGFGSAISVTPDLSYIAVGSWRYSYLRIYTLTETDTWALQAKIIATDAADGVMWVGRNLAMSDDGSILASGSINGNQRRGICLVYQRTGTTWTQIQRIQPAYIADNDNFGASTCMSGNKILVVGATQDAYSSGYVVVYYWNGTQFIELQQIKSADYGAWTYSMVGNYFSTCINQDGSKMAFICQNGTQGTTYIFSRDPSIVTNTFTIFATLPNAGGVGARCQSNVRCSSDMKYLITGGWFGTSVAHTYLYKLTATGAVLQADLTVPIDLSGVGGLSQVAISGDGTYGLVLVPDQTTPGYYYTYVYN